MLSPTLPAHQKQGKGSTLAAQGRQGGTDTPGTRVGFCVRMGQKLRNVPSKSLFQGIDEALSAIKSRRNCLTLPLNPLSLKPHPLSPGVWLGELGVGEKSVRWSGRCRIEALGH
jgi:hypothetical protein